MRYTEVDGRKQRIPIALSLCEGEIYPEIDLKGGANTGDGNATSATQTSAVAPISASAVAPADSETTSLVAGKFPENCFFKCEDFVNNTHGNLKKYDVIMW